MDPMYEKKVKHAEQLAAGFLAVVFTSFLSNLSMDNRSAYANYSLWLLCAAQPMLIIWWMDFYDKPDEDRHEAIGIKFAGFVGYFGGYVGLSLLIYHVNEIAEFVFLGATLLALGFFGAESNKKKKDAASAEVEQGLAAPEGQQPPSSAGLQPQPDS